MDRMVKIGKYIIGAFGVLIVIGLFMPSFSHTATKSERHSKPSFSNLEDTWFGAERTTTIELPSYYDGKGNINYTIFSDQAYGDMICRVIAFDDENYAGMKYFTLGGPYQKSWTDKTINLGEWSGIIGETVVECRLDPTK